MMNPMMNNNMPMMNMNMMNMNNMNNMPMMNNMNNMNNIQMMNNMQMMKNMQMMNNMNQMNQMNQMNYTLMRLKKEFELCSNDNDLTGIGCTFGLVNDNNYFKWKVSMIGPKGTPYENGVFVIHIIFPNNYPKEGAEFRFINKIYHLNVDMRDQESFGHICLSSLNEWRTTGKVLSKKGYCVKQALFDIFCLFYQQGIDSPYDPQMAALYRDNPQKFNEIAKQWTEKYAH